jgi:invasion protein IalB
MLAATVLMADTTPAAAAAATTVTPASAPAAAAPAKTADKPKLICKTEPVIGSLISKKTCYTSDQMAQRRQDERENLEKMQTQIGMTVH